MAGRVLTTWVRRDMEFGGAYKIAVTTQRSGIPVGRKRVRLYDRRSARLVREGWSDNSADLTFDYIKYLSKGYVAQVFDEDGQSGFKDPDTIDLITPEII